MNTAGKAWKTSANGKMADNPFLTWSYNRHLTEMIRVGNETAAQPPTREDVHRSRGLNELQAKGIQELEPLILVVTKTNESVENLALAIQQADCQKK